MRAQVLREPLGAGRADRGRGDALDPGLVPHRAGVREVVEAQRHRTHDHGDRAEARGLDRARATLVDGLPIGMERIDLRGVHRPVVEHDLAANALAERAQLVERQHADDGTAHAALRSRHAAAEGEDRERRRRLGALAPELEPRDATADPARHGALLEPHVRESVREHRPLRPRDGVLRAGRAREPVRGHATELLQLRERLAARERRLDQARNDHGALGLCPFGGLLRARDVRQGERQEAGRKQEERDRVRTLGGDHRRGGFPGCWRLIRRRAARGV
ncbi:MAG: hypothetical protein IPJ77_17215 [Planctomycetes bacterium]|nr:hypothetical protein [Planctomycetota bacterium]